MDRTTRTARDHQGLEVIPPEECWQLLRDAPVGRVAFIETGDPMILPVNHTVVGHRIVFRTLRGTLLHEALMAASVAFQVDGADPVQRTGWSVLVRGVADLADDPDELAGPAPVGRHRRPGRLGPDPARRGHRPPHRPRRLKTFTPAQVAAVDPGSGSGRRTWPRGVRPPR